MPYWENRHGERLWYRDEGEGPLMLLVHGWCMSSSIWEFQYRALGQRYRLVAPDLRGHGYSEAGRRTATLAQLVDDLQDLVRHLAFPPVLQLGWSLGAQVLLAAASALPSPRAGAVLVGGTPRFVSGTDYPWGLPQQELAGMRLKVQRSPERAVRGFRSLMFTDRERQLDRFPEMAALLELPAIPCQRVIEECLDILEYTDLRPALPARQLSTLVVTGDGDRICPPGASRYLASRCPGARLLEFAGCGHAPFLSDPDRFNEAVIMRMEEADVAGVV